MMRAAAPETLELLLLEYTQQLRLQWQWDISDFIEEHCPSVGNFETADFLGDSPCELALLMPKETRKKGFATTEDRLRMGRLRIKSEHDRELVKGCRKLDTLSKSRRWPSSTAC